jgi:hypothetical protein
MAKQASFLKIEGTLDDITFYKSKDGYLVRKKGGVSKKRINSDPAFARTRENGKKFGHSASSGKTLRRAVLTLLNKAKDARVVSRVTKIMSQIKNEDLTSIRGERQVAIGLATPTGKTLLKSFDFNSNAVLDTVLLTEHSLDTVTGVITIPDLVPAKQLSIPQGATHVSFTAGFLNLDFSTGDKDLQLSPIVNSAINLTSATVTLTPAGVPTGTGNSMYLIHIEFFQELNGVQYSLNNGAYNTLNLLEVL